LRISANGRQNNERVLTVADYATLKGTLRSVTQLISRSSAEGQKMMVMMMMIISINIIIIIIIIVKMQLL